MFRDGKRISLNVLEACFFLLSVMNVLRVTSFSDDVDVWNFHLSFTDQSASCVFENNVSHNYNYRLNFFNDYRIKGIHIEKTTLAIVQYSH